MRKLVKTLGTLVLALGLGACSSNPQTNEPAPAIHLDLPGPSIQSVTPGQFVTLGAPIGYFSGCRLVHDDGTVTDATPHFVLRLPDGDGQRYGFTDGYTLPFPTPWISAQGGTTWGGTGTGCDPAGACLYEPDIYKFEQALYAIPVVSHQFLVYELSFYKSDTSTTTFVVGDKQWFYNGTQDYTKVDERNAVVNQWAGDGHIEPQKLNCVYVTQQSGTSSIVYTGYHADVAQSHDPINYPN